MLTGQSSQSEHKICPEEVAATECVENITTTALLDAVHEGSHDHQTSVQVVTGTSGPDEDHAHYTHVAHLSEGQVIHPYWILHGIFSSSSSVITFGAVLHLPLINI